MEITNIQRMPKKLPASMKMSTLTNEERIQCEIKLTLTKKLDNKPDTTSNTKRSDPTRNSNQREFL